MNEFQAKDQSMIKRGFLWNSLGRLAGMVQGVYFFSARHMVGGEAFGLFIIAYNFIEIVARLFIGGFGDSLTYFSARYSTSIQLSRGEEEREKNTKLLYQSLAALFWIPLWSALALALVFHLAAPQIHRLFWSHLSTDIIILLRLLGWTLPLGVLARLPLAAVKGKMEMKYAVLVEDTFLPLATFVLFLMGWGFGWGAFALAWGYLGALALSGVLSLYYYSRYYSLTHTLQNGLAFRYNYHCLPFSITQGANTLLNYGLVRVDALMLSLWVTPNLVGIYALVSELGRGIRAAKTSFSSVFAPLVAKYKEQNNKQGMEEALNKVSHWTATLCLVIVVPVLLFYSDVILGPGKPWSYSFWVPILLCLGPCVSCFIGLSGNVLLMTGHNKLLLFNSAIAFSLNILLNYWWIPLWGILGAALATSFSGILITGLQTYQMGRLESLKFHFPLFRVSAPFAAGCLLVLPWIQTEFFHGHFLPHHWVGVLVVKGTLLIGLYLFIWKLLQALDPDFDLGNLWKTLIHRKWMRHA